MEPELQDVIGFVACFLLDLFERVDVVWIENYWLFADDVAAEAQAIADEGVVRVIRSADTDPVQRPVSLHLLGAKTVEELVLGEERALREETIEASDAVKTVVGRQQVIACILDGFKMTRGDISGSADQCEVGHYASTLSESLDL